MEVIKKIKDLKIIEQKRPIALIPTMGNLHDGHLSLIKKAKNLKLNSLVTIFVNPLQFGPDEDFEKYPRTTFEDIAKLIPLMAKIYPAFVGHDAQSHHPNMFPRTRFHDSHHPNILNIAAHREAFRIASFPSYRTCFRGALH